MIKNLDKLKQAWKISTLKVWAKFLWLFYCYQCWHGWCVRPILTKFWQVWQSLNKFDKAWPILDKLDREVLLSSTNFGQVWTSLDKFGNWQVQNHLDCQYKKFKTADRNNLNVLSSGVQFYTVVVIKCTPLLQRMTPLLSKWLKLSVWKV